jgi:hypothetical protein
MAAKEAQSELWTLATGWSGMKEIADMSILLIGVSGGAPNIRTKDETRKGKIEIN